MVIPIRPVLRSVTGITIESNNQGSRKVTIAAIIEINDQERFSTVKVYVHQCTSPQKTTSPFTPILFWYPPVLIPVVNLSTVYIGVAAL